MTPEITAAVVAALSLAFGGLGTGIRMVYTRGNDKQDALELKVDAAGHRVELDLAECKDHRDKCEADGIVMRTDILTLSGKVERLEGRIEGA